MTVGFDNLLVRSPSVCGGKLRIEGTRITLLQIATLYRQGMTAEEIAEQCPHLTLAQVRRPRLLPRQPGGDRRRARDGG